MTRVYERQYQGRCGVLSLQDKDSGYGDVDVDGEIVTRPIWKCRCCHHEEKRIVRKSAKAKRIEAGLNAYLAKMIAQKRP